MKKAPATPETAMSTPAAAGPRTRAAWNAPELRAMAFDRSSFPTSSTTKACRAGVSSACTAPRRKARRRTCQKRTVPVQQRAASRNARTIIAAWHQKITLRFSKRSTIAPA